MNGLILPPKPIEAAIPKEPCCGNCGYSEPSGPSMVMCFGAPPVPVVMGAGTNLAGQQGIQINMLRPQLATTERPCALHRSKLALMTIEGEG